MKNKTKMGKIKNNAAQGAKTAKQQVKKPTMPAEWFYMNDRKVTVTDIRQAYESSGLIPGTQVEIWEEAGVIEIEIEDQRSFVFESIPVDLHDEASNQFLEEHDVKALFAVTIDAEHYVIAHKIMGRIMGGLDGFFCGDTIDFQPIVNS